MGFHIATSAAAHISFRFIRVKHSRGAKYIIIVLAKLEPIEATAAAAAAAADAADAVYELQLSH